MEARSGEFDHAFMANPTIIHMTVAVTETT
jgi:hypothetical protein